MEEGAGVQPTAAVYERYRNAYVHQEIDRTALPPCSTHTGGIPQPGAGCRKRAALPPRRVREAHVARIDHLAPCSMERVLPQHPYQQRCSGMAPTSELPWTTTDVLLHGGTAASRGSQIDHHPGRLISEKKLQIHKSKTYIHLQAKIFQLWQEYEDGHMSARQLLNGCAKVYGPAV